MSQLAVHRPLDERHLDDDLRPHPVRAHAWETCGPRERCRRNFQPIELLAELAEQLRIEAGAHLARVNEVVAVWLVVADQKRAEANASPLRVSEPANDQLLRRLALH